MDRTIRLILACLLASASLTTGYAETSVNEFLLQAEQQVPPLAANDQRSGWLESVQVRASVDDSDKNKNSYALRVKPKTPTTRRSEKLISQLNHQQHLIEYHATLSSTLSNRYSQLIDIAELFEKIRLLKDLQKAGNSEIMVYRNAVKTGSFNPIKLQKAELASESLELTLMNTEQILSRIKSLSDIDLEREHLSGSLISIEEIQKILNNLDKSMDSSQLTQQQLETEIALAELNRNESRQGFGIDYLQLEKSTEESSKESETHEISIGINIPLGNSYKLSKSRLAIQRARFQSRQTEILEQDKNQNLRDSIDIGLREYSSRKHLVSNLNSRLIKIKETNEKLLIVALEKEKIKQNLKLSEIKHSLYRNYIEYLSFTNKLIEKPARNWLYTSTPELSRN